MSQVRLENVGFGYSSPLFKDVNLTIDSGDRVGVVGNNGSGKSTLLRCIAGLVEPNVGKVVRSRGLRFGFIEQTVPNHLQELSLREVIAAALPPAERDYNEWRVDIALDTFKAPAAIRERSIKALSGGWQRLALIARLGLSDPDMLLLDEPTNHLDIAKMTVLEQWLNEQVASLPLIAISHDRRFLKNCTSKTIFLRGLEVREFEYSYERAKTLLLDDDRAAAHHREQEMKEMARLKASAHELRQIGVNNRSDAALKKSVQIARRAERIESALTPIHTEARRDLKLANSGISAKRLIGISDVIVSTPDGTKLFHIEELEVMQGDRIIVMGANGSGKSLFLSRLNRSFGNIDLAREQGIIIAPNAKPSFIDQHLSHLQSKRSLRDYISYEFGLDDQRTTSVLVNAGFSIIQQGHRLEALSQGQRARLALLGLRLLSPNIYIMDEPTNHLDISGQEQLESEILLHQAASIFASHDRSFVQNIGTRFCAIDEGRLIEIASPDIFYDALLAAQESGRSLQNLGLARRRSGRRT